MNSTVKSYIGNMSFSIPRFALERAVRRLEWVEGLALIRACVKEEDGGFATLEAAKEIYTCITRQRLYHDNRSLG